MKEGVKGKEQKWTERRADVAGQVGWCWGAHEDEAGGCCSLCPETKAIEQLTGGKT